MGDWRRTQRVSVARHNDATGRGMATSGGIFEGLLDAVSGEKQTAQLTYAGGSNSTPLPMPFESTDSWIRSIPLSGSAALLAYRRDDGEATFIRYLNDEPSKKLEMYEAGKNLYRPLLPGEHEIHSSGYAQSYYGQRPVLEHRAGIIRSWLDQDRAECGQKAPLHTRQLHSHRSNSVGDEERFGVVRRPRMNNLLNMVVQLSLYSSNFSKYPYPDFSLPGGIPAAFSLLAEAIGTASEIIGAMTGMFKIRPFAKEYLRVIKNPLAPLPPFTLIDIREGQVFNDEGFQVIGSNGAYLRAQHEYYTTLIHPTTFQVDEMGNVSWSLSIGAMAGWSTLVPFGAWKVNASLGVDIFTLTSFSSMSMLGTSLQAATELSLEGLISMSFTSGLTFSHSALGLYTVDAKMPIVLKSEMNIMTEAKLLHESKAAVQMNLVAPIIQIGTAPTEPTVLGLQLSTWLQTLVNLFVNNAAFLGSGNMGAPVPLNPAIATGLSSLLAQVPMLASKTIMVSP